MKNVIFGLIFGVILISGISFAYADSHREGDYKLVIINTTKGDIVVELFPDDAPNHVENFIDLAESGFYESTVFHRIIDGFMIQGGDQQTRDLLIMDRWGTGSPGYTIDEEFNDIKHWRGILSMARGQSPDSAGSQFFIVHKNSFWLDGQYTVFGRIITEESYRVLDKIASVETNDKDVPLDPDAVTIINMKTMYRGAAGHSGNPHILLDKDPPGRISDGGPMVPPDLAGSSSTSSMSTSTTNPNWQTFESKLYGVKFDIPPGWNLQQPPKTSPNAPDFVALGPTSGKIPEAITLTIANTDGRTIDEVVEEKKSRLATITEGLDMKYMRADVVNGKPSHSLLAQGTFETNDELFSVIFVETLIYDTNKIYTFSSISDNLKTVDEQEKLLRQAANSFEIVSSGTPIPETEVTSQTTPSEGGGCLIATAAYGSEMAPQVQFLRELRDNTILQTQSGTAFMTGFNQFYYSFSPAVADYERENPMFKEAVKLTLTPLLTSLAILNYVDIDTEQEMLGYGIGVILLNIGMYFVAPTAVIIAIKNRRK